MSRIKKLYDDSWMYILLLTTLTILLYSLSTYKFSVSDTKITYSILGLPLVFFIANYITKKYNYAKTVTAIATSAVFMVIFVLVVNFALGKETVLIDISGHFCGYVISQFVNLTIYYFLIQNTNQPLPLIFLTYLFSLIVFYMFYTIINLNMMISEQYWSGYFITLCIQSLICAIISIIDKKTIRKGRDN